MIRTNSGSRIGYVSLWLGLGLLAVVVTAAESEAYLVVLLVLAVGAGGLLAMGALSMLARRYSRTQVAGVFPQD